ncbi:MAG: flagellar biosynthetic protein FliQ [bacterium]
MDVQFVIDIGSIALWNAFIIATPLLMAGVGVGLVVSILQTATSIQEQTLTFVPKILALITVIGILGPWMIQRLMHFTLQVWGLMTKIP